MTNKKSDWHKRARAINAIKTVAIYILLVSTAVLATMVLPHKVETQPVSTFKEVIKEVEVKIVEKEVPLFFDIEHNEWQLFVVTAYSLNDPEQGTTNIVATGIDASQLKLPICAVDPLVIPLYSIIEIENLGAFCCIDTGGLIKGNRIDILFPTKYEAVQFGSKYLRIRLLK